MLPETTVPPCCVYFLVIYCFFFTIQLTALHSFVDSCHASKKKHNINSQSGSFGTVNSGWRGKKTIKEPNKNMVFLIPVCAFITNLVDINIIIFLCKQ